MFNQVMSLQNSPTYRRSLAERLERERASKNDGTIPGGLASMIDAGTAGYLRYRDDQDRTKAQSAMMGGITEATDIGEMGEDQIPAGPEGALYRLGQLEDNPYAGRLSQMLTFEQMQRQQQAEAAQQQFQVQMMRDQMNNQARIQASAAGRPSVNVSTGGVPNDPLLETLAKKEADTWSSYSTQGNAAADKMMDFEALEALSDQVPSGPLMGRAAEMFPEMSDASAAFMSIVSRVAPQMRVPGSGATSDKEVEMFLRSLPRLRYEPGANKAIVSMLKAKAQIDMARSEIVAAASNGQITPQDARERMRELNQQSILPKELRSLVSPQQGGGGGTATPSRRRYNPQTGQFEEVR